VENVENSVDKHKTTISFFYPSETLDNGYFVQNETFITKILQQCVKITKPLIYNIFATLEHLFVTNVSASGGQSFSKIRS